MDPELSLQDTFYDGVFGIVIATTEMNLFKGSMYIWNLGKPEFIYEFMKHMNSYMKESYEFIDDMNLYRNSYI